jgi:hypothetical protein
MRQWPWVESCCAGHANGSGIRKKLRARTLEILRARCHLYVSSAMQTVTVVRSPDHRAKLRGSAALRWSGQLRSCHRTRCPSCPCSHAQGPGRVGLGGQRNVLDFLGDLGRGLHHVLDEFLDFRLGDRLGVHVDEDRAGSAARRCRPAQRLPCSGPRPRPLGFTMGTALSLACVLGVVGVAEVANGVHVRAHALHQHVVVFRGGEVATAGSWLLPLMASVK